MERPELEEQETGNRFADGLLLPIFAVAAVFLFIVLCFYAYNHVMKNKNSNEIVILDGEESDFKVVPQDPGGMEVEHTDKAVFNTVTGEVENISAEGVNVEQQEAPVSQEQLAASSEGTVATIEVPTKEGETATITITPEEEKAPAPAATEEAPAVVAEDAAPEAVKLEAAPAATEAPKTEEAPKETAAPAEATTPAPVEIKESAKTSDSSKPIEADVKKETDKTTGESKTVIQFREPPKSMSGKTAPSSIGSSSAAVSGKYYVQVSSHATKSEAESAWTKLNSKYSAEIDGHGKNITSAEVQGKTFYRLSFGPFGDRSAASTQCGILKAKGQDCIIQKY